MNRQLVRVIAAGAAVASAVLYYLIGFELLDIGESASGADPGLLGFGLTVGTVFLGIAALLTFVSNRWILAIIGLVDLAPLIGYFALAGIREPSFELWGLLIKAFQLVVFVGVGVLMVRREAVPEHGGIRQDVLTAKASSA